tara:strand:- start:89 stop:2926 length:2838 start_codon:yes stop_codon:yes gene_type:complete
MDNYLVIVSSPNKKRPFSSKETLPTVAKKQKLLGGAEGQGPKKSSQLWDRLSKIRNSEALKGKQFISNSFPLGFDHVKLPEHYKKNIVLQVVKAKQEHPDAIILVKNGLFFNACGVDAVLCMEYCPLMSRQNTANIGAHAVKIQSYIDMLLSENLEIIVVEKEGKEYTRQLMNKFNPLYLGSNTHAEIDGDIPVRIAIAITGDVCDVHVINDMEKRIESYNNIYLTTLPIITDMYPSNQLYSMGKYPCGKDTIRLDWSCDRTEFLKKFIYYQLKSTIQYTEKVCSDIAQRCTIEQLGLLPNNTMRGVPSLLDAICPDIGKKCRHLVSKMLICPPDLSVSALFRHTVQKYPLLRKAMPKSPSRSLALHSTMLVLRKKKASASYLRNIYQFLKWTTTIHDFQSALTNGDTFSGQELIRLTHMLSNTNQSDLSHSQCVLIEKSLGIDEENISKPEYKTMTSFEKQMVLSCEKWHGNISAEASASFNKKVLEARSHFCTSILKSTLSIGDIIWCPELRAALTTKQIGNATLALDRKGNPMKGEFKKLFTIPNVHTSKQRYQNVCEQAQQKADEILHKLNSDICEKTLSFANNLWCWDRIIHTHVSNNSGWNVPGIVEIDRPVLQLKGFKPFWLNSSAVSNDIDINSMQLLSGGNTGGKSTLCRSVAGIAILAKAGFLVPADYCVVSQGLDIFLNVGNADCATSGLSGWSSECNDMASLFQMVGGENHVLAIIDELCAGTSSREGIPSCIGYIKALATTNTIGLVSTHFDDVLSSHELEDIPKKQMENDGNGQFTYKLIDGVCRYRYATLAMRKAGVPEYVVDDIDERISRSFTVKKVTELSPIDVIVNKLGDFHICLGKSMQCPVISSSCLYLLKCAGGFYYIGESDNIAQRFKTHFASTKNPTKMWIWQMENKSLARKMESNITSIFKRRAIPLLSSNDGNHTHFGGN